MVREPYFACTQVVRQATGLFNAAVKILNRSFSLREIHMNEIRVIFIDLKKIPNTLSYILISTKYNRYKKLLKINTFQL